MTELAKCGSAACDPVIQIRGEMGPGDYRNVYNPDGTPDTEFYKKVELLDPVPAIAGGGQASPGNKKDVRVMCRKCGHASAWNLGEVPMPGLKPEDAAAMAREVAVKQWNDHVAGKRTKSEMVDALEKQFGADAVAKHFGHSL